jgi:hypothetical protein
MHHVRGCVLGPQVHVEIDAVGRYLGWSGCLHRLVVPDRVQRLTPRRRLLMTGNQWVSSRRMVRLHDSWCACVRGAGRMGQQTGKGDCGVEPVRCGDARLRCRVLDPRCLTGSQHITDVLRRQGIDTNGDTRGRAVDTRFPWGHRCQLYMDDPTRQSHWDLTAEDILQEGVPALDVTGFLVSEQRRVQMLP